MTIVLKLHSMNWFLKTQRQKKTDGLKYFSGYVAYNLEKGFIESTKFENSMAKFTISGDKLPITGTTNIFGKYEIDPPAASYCLGDVIICNDYYNESGGGSYYAEA